MASWPRYRIRTRTPNWKHHEIETLDSKLKLKLKLKLKQSSRYLPMWLSFIGRAVGPSEWETALFRTADKTRANTTVLYYINIYRVFLLVEIAKDSYVMIYNIDYLMFSMQHMFKFCLSKAAQAMTSSHEDCTSLALGGSASSVGVRKVVQARLQSWVKQLEPSILTHCGNNWPLLKLDISQYISIYFIFWGPACKFWQARCHKNTQTSCERLGVPWKFKLFQQLWQWRS